LWWSEAAEFCKIIYIFAKMDLNTLLQRAQNLTNEAKAECELPAVERTLQQVLQATTELHSRVTQTGGKEIQA